MRCAAKRWRRTTGWTGSDDRRKSEPVSRCAEPIGAVNAATSGGVPWYFSTLPSTVCPQLLCASHDVAIFSVSVFTSPFAQRPHLVRLKRIEPATLVDPNHARTDYPCQHSRQQLPTIVEHPRHVTILDAACGSIAGMVHVPQSDSSPAASCHTVATQSHP